jgi:hypothetical protein
MIPAKTMMIPENKKKKKLKKLGLDKTLYKTTEDLQILMRTPSKISSRVHLEEHYFLQSNEIND